MPLPPVTTDGEEYSRATVYSQQIPATSSQAPPLSNDVVEIGKVCSPSTGSTPCSCTMATPLARRRPCTHHIHGPLRLTCTWYVEHVPHVQRVQPEEKLGESSHVLASHPQHHHYIHHHSDELLRSRSEHTTTASRIQHSPFYPQPSHLPPGQHSVP